MNERGNAVAIRSIQWVLFAFSDAVVVCWLTGWVEAQPIRNAPRNERTVSLSKVDFIVRHLSNAHATTFRCNFSEAAEKFFNEMCPIAVPKAGRHGSSFGTRMSDMTDENKNPAGNLFVRPICDPKASGSFSDRSGRGADFAAKKNERRDFRCIEITVHHPCDSVIRRETSGDRARNMACL